MHADHKREMLKAWRQLYMCPQIDLTPEEHYERLLKMADRLEHIGVISSTEWRQLIREAGKVIAESK